MAQRVDRPFLYHWLRWHTQDKFRGNAIQRRAIWDFLQRIHRMPPGSLAIDCGANIGNVTSAFVRRGFRVHAFEPDSFARGLLARRYGNHPLVIIHPEAVGGHAGTLTLYRARDFQERPKVATMSSSLLLRPQHDAAGAEQVSVIDLSNFIRDLGEPVDLLKLDVEGAEVDVINHLIDEGTHQSIGMIYVETHERHSPELAERTMKLRQRVIAEGIDNINLDWR